LIEKKDLENIVKLYIRSERQDGYYFKNNGADMVTINNPAYSGSDETFLQHIREKYIETSFKKPLSVYASFYSGSEVSLTLFSEGVSVTVTGDVMALAQKQPVTEEMIARQLCKLGDTCFELENIEVSTDNLGFYSVKMLNELRRKAVHALENEMIASYGLAVDRTCEVSCPIIQEFGNTTCEHQNAWSVLVSTDSQLDIVYSYCQSEPKITNIYIESDLLLNHPNCKLPEHAQVYVALPYIMRQRDVSTMNKILLLASERPVIKGMLFRNYEEYEFLKSACYTGKLIADAGIYVWNRLSYAFWQDKVDHVTCPIELNQHEWIPIFHDHPVEKIVYGRLPMMLTANCIAKTGGYCLKGKESSIAWLTDRYKKKFPVILQCRFCYNIILNSVPLSLHGKENRKWYDKTIKRLTFTTEDASETKQTLDFFLNLENELSVQPPYEDYTTGHEKRGVE